MSRFIALLIGLLWLSVPLHAEEYPAQSDPYVTDIADLLPEQAEIRLRSKLAALRSDTGIEASVVTIPSRSVYTPEAPSVEAFATGLFNAWGIGNPDRNDGILLLVIAEDKETRLELGAGYNQGYDVLAQDIVSRWLVPAFREGDYSDGIEAGMDAVMDRIARRHGARLEPEALPDRPGKMWDNLGAWIFGAVFALVAGFAIFGRRMSDIAVGLKRCANCGSRTLSRSRTTLVHAGPGVPGTSRVVTSCITCGNRDEREERIGAGRRGGSSGRDSGFGGGRSSGGGASGRW